MEDAGAARSVAVDVAGIVTVVEVAGAAKRGRRRRCERSVAIDVAGRRAFEHADRRLRQRRDRAPQVAGATAGLTANAQPACQSHAQGSASVPSAPTSRTSDRDSDRACLPTPKRDGLSFPYARLDNGRLVHVDQHDGVSAVWCLGCGADMHARGGGPKVRRHFAHRVRVEGTCSHESALHAATKQAICDSFAGAKAAARPYKLLWICEGCESIRDVDLVGPYDRVTPETEMVAGVVSDLAFEGSRRFAVEVVVTHAPEPQALSRYKAAAIPVFIVRPTWDTIATLANCIHADASHFTRVDKCPECQRQRAAREAEERERERVLALLRTSLSQLAPSSPPCTWNTDKRGAPLYPQIAAKLHETGRRLCAEGFKQAQQKPWLYILRIKGVGTFFANMGGTAEVPIWKDTTPLYHWNLDDRVASHEELIVLLVRDHLAARGIELRTSFYSLY